MTNKSSRCCCFEGVLDADIATQFNEHRAACTGCETYRHQMKSTMLSGFRDLCR